MVKKEVIKIGVDLDGVIATHPLKGFWVKLRRLKEKILKKVNSTTYYYPATLLEKTSWKAINWLKKPISDQGGLFSSLAQKNEVQFYLVTGRFNFLDKLTKKWLEKHQLKDFFYKIQINSDDLDPTIFKEKAVKKLGLDIFIDDDLEVLEYLKNRTKAKLFWIVPKYLNKIVNLNSRIENCGGFLDALRKIFNLPKNN